MPSYEALKRALRMRMGLPPGHPTDAELAQIIQFILAIQSTGDSTDADWRAACEKYVPGAGTHVYAAADNSDLNELLRRIRG